MSDEPKTVEPLASVMQIQILNMKRERDRLLREAHDNKIKAEQLSKVIGPLEDKLLYNSNFEPEDLQ